MESLKFKAGYRAGRREALGEFERLAWPSPSDEEWRRTDPNLIPLFAAESLTASSSGFTIGWEEVPREKIGGGVIVTNFKNAFQQFPALVEKYLDKVGLPEGLKKFVHLHRALWEDGLFCYIPEGGAVPVPLVTHITAAFHGRDTQRSGAAIFPHVLIVLEPEAQLTLIDGRYSAQGTEAPTSGEKNGAPPILSNEMVEIILGAGARLTYIHLQEWGKQVRELFTQRALLEEGAQFLNVTVGLGATLTKANVETILAGSGSRCDLLAVLFGFGQQHFDFHTLQDHRAHHTVSELLYKSALKERSQAIYTGLIRIRKEAQKSDAYQANRNLLLSDGAKADSIPMLEIEADDVRCTHGVAVGPVEEEQLFYLMSRGLSPQESQRLIVEGFFDQIFQRIPSDSVREHLTAEVARRL